MSPEEAERICATIENDSGVVSYAELDAMKVCMHEFPAELKLRALAALKKMGRA